MSLLHRPSVKHQKPTSTRVAGRSKRRLGRSLARPGFNHCGATRQVFSMAIHACEAPPVTLASCDPPFREGEAPTEPYPLPEPSTQLP